MSESVYNAFFVDLFVRVSNTLAINMYNAFGYSVYRRVIGYYSGEEDAFGEHQPPYSISADCCIVLVGSFPSYLPRRRMHSECAVDPPPCRIYCLLSRSDVTPCVLAETPSMRAVQRIRCGKKRIDQECTM